MAAPKDRYPHEYMPREYREYAAPVDYNAMATAIASAISTALKAGADSNTAILVAIGKLEVQLQSIAGELKESQKHQDIVDARVAVIERAGIQPSEQAEIREAIRWVGNFRAQLAATKVMVASIGAVLGALISLAVNTILWHWPAIAPNVRVP